jgi:hypothetical protein
MSEDVSIIWTEYFKYRCGFRGFELSSVENILRYSEERYFDIVTQSNIVAGKHDSRLVIIPYEITKGSITPITIHATTRQQINFRLRTGRFINE